MPQTALILGASGLTGSHLLNMLLESPSFSHVRSLVRKPSGISHPKLEEIIVDFQNMEQYKQAIGRGDVIFSCIGTTLKKVKGDKQLYKQIDFDIPVNAARFGIEAGYKQFVLISAHLANAQSMIFYNRLKGETEDIIQTFPFESIHIFRPSFLIGERKERRWLELTFGELMVYLSPLLPDASKPIEVSMVAKAMMNVAIKGKNGNHIYPNEQIKNLAR
jgi:uncharacterized protein YbjT (DUF2867 family)